MKIVTLPFRFALLFLFFLFAISPADAQRRRKARQFVTAVDTALYGQLKYRLVGPFRGGRSAAVTGVEGEPNLFYFGATGGGVWRTRDGGRHWENISDGYFGGSIGSIAVAPSDHNVIYVGGGEKTVRGNVSSGYGIWKSVDAGKTWTSMGLPESRHVSRIRVHPDNPDVVFAAVMGNLYKPTPERGVYKSTDGGQTWKKVLFANEMAGAVDLSFDPGNPRILYASTWRVQRTPYSLSSGGEGSALWKSTDSGEHWQRISDNKGFPADTLGIIGIAVSPVQAERLWAMVENKDQGGLYRSDDGGASWKRVNAQRMLRQRAWYYTRVYADTHDPNTVYVLNVRYHKSTDGGVTFATDNAPHGDHHDLWIAPEDPSRMIIGDDGGAQVTYDGGETWSTYHNQPTSQFYRVTTDNAFPFRIYAAQQDNSTIRISHRSDGYSIDEEDWESTAGGESAHIAVDPMDNDIVYGGSYGGYLTRVNHRTRTQRAINVWPDNPMGYGAEGMKYRFQWNFPIFFSKHDPKALYALSNHVHRSRDEGQSWELLSGDLTRNDPAKLVSSGGPITQDNTGVEYYCTLFAASESPLNEGELWVGSDDGLVHLTRDGGKNWERVTPAGLPDWSMINSLEASSHNPGTCYLAATRYKLGDFTPLLYKTSDYGQTWSRITAGIPPEHFTRVIREDPKVPGVLYAGTETGMYISFDDGTSWQSLQLNLPIVPITDLTIKENSLVVATQGRSLWILDDLGVLQEVAVDRTASASRLFVPADAYRTKGGSSNRPSLLAGQNKANGVTTYYYLPSVAPKDSIHLTYFSRSGDTLARFSTASNKEDRKLEVHPGLNAQHWDTRGEKAEKLEGMILWWASLEGPRAVPGKYEVELDVNGRKARSLFELKKDPRAEATIEEMTEQYEFVSAINATINAAHGTIEEIRKINGKLDEFMENFEGARGTDSLVVKARDIRDRLQAIEKELYQTRNRSAQDPLNFPIKLTNKLAHLVSLVSMDDFPPTEQDKAVRKELTEEIERQLSLFRSVLNQDIRAFNEAFTEAQLPYLKVEDK